MLPETHANVDRGSSERSGFDYNRAADEPNSFLHTGKTEALASPCCFHVESLAEITNGEMNLA